MIRQSEIRVGDTIYTQNQAFEVEDLEEYPEIKAFNWTTQKERTFNAEHLWSPEVGVFMEEPK